MLVNYSINFFLFLPIGLQPTSTIMPGGASPGTPAKLKDKAMLRTKVVIALYPFRAIESGDLSLEKVRFIYK